MPSNDPHYIYMLCVAGPSSCYLFREYFLFQIQDICQHKKPPGHVWVGRWLGEENMVKPGSETFYINGEFENIDENTLGFV